MGTAYAPYSRFRVGAAVLGESGRIYTGSNVENSSYGLTLCAERVAIVAAVHAGERVILKVAVATETEAPVPPCGACRQVLHEFGARARVILGTMKGDQRITSLDALLPDAFDPAVLPGHDPR